MAYYLIDFENVKSRGMEGVELLTEEDTVCIFYSDNADSMTFDLHRKLNETKAKNKKRSILSVSLLMVIRFIVVCFYKISCISA